MSESMLRILEALAVNSGDDATSINAKTMVLRALREPYFKEVVEMPASSQVIWFGENSDDMFVDDYDEEVYETISSFLRIMQVIKPLYEQEGQQ